MPCDQQFPLVLVNVLTTGAENISLLSICQVSQYQLTSESC